MNTSSYNILVTGGNGQLASAIKKVTTNKRFIFCDKSALDITSRDSIAKAINQYRPGMIINTAAYTAVDQAENHPDEAMKINCEGAKNIAMSCTANNIGLLHVSTDYVFEGALQKGYDEDAETNPLNTYGKTKLLGEQAVIEHCPNHIILRVSGVFSEFGHNFLKTILRLAREKQFLSVVNDQFTCPTYAGDIAKAMIDMINQPVSGIYHYCGLPIVSWHKFASYIIHQAKLTLPVQETKTADYPTPARRPTYGILNCEKIRDTYGITQPDWRFAVKEIVPLLSKRNHS